jgi:glycosyltransferase involved in cell wall biosynthesis
LVWTVIYTLTNTLKKGNFYLKKAYVSVINDLVTDQRVHKSCVALQKSGYEVVLIGRKLKHSLPMPSLTYKTVRMRLLFVRGPLFYAEFNIRLFLFLLFKKVNLFLSNDLDTLLPNFLVSRLRNIPLAYDSHEYYTETPELVNRKFVQHVWKLMEQFMLSRIDRMITVNESIAQMFRQEYGIEVVVVRNIPPSIKISTTKSRSDLGLPVEKKLLILQGSGINIDRGVEELVLAMQYIDNSVLLLIGNGDAMPVIRNLIKDNHLEDKVMLFPRMNYNEMMCYTQLADVGFTLDKDTNLNYRFSLPNKLFDYIHAGIPVLATPLVEIKAIIDRFQIGGFIDSHQPDIMAKQIGNYLIQNDLMRVWRKNLSFAAESLNWENEEKILLKFYSTL